MRFERNSIMKPHHLLSLLDVSREGLDGILAHALRLKEERSEPVVTRHLAGKTIALIFSKSSTRTRVSFHAAIYELGGNPMFLDHDDLQLGRGESMSDTAKTLNRYIHAVIIRAHQHSSLVEYARHSAIPVINALTDKFHPCQLVADLLTILEHKGRLEGIKVAYIGDGANNMANSWVIAAKLMGMELRIGAPSEFQPPVSFLNSVKGAGSVKITDDPVAAVKGADIVYTDVWVSMGFENESSDRLKKLTPYQVNQSLMAHADKDVKVMHCLPAHREQEITAEVLDGPSSIVWDQAGNRLHAQKAILARLIKRSSSPKTNDPVRHGSLL